MGEYNFPQSQAAYQRLIAEWQVQGERLIPQSATTEISIATLCVRYLDHCESWYPNAKWNETKQTELALRYLQPYLTIPANDFGPLKLKAVRQIMLDATSEKTGKKLSRQYINKLVDRLVRMFRWAAENELFPILVLMLLRCNSRAIWRSEYRLEIRKFPHPHSSPTIRHHSPDTKRRFSPVGLRG